MMSEHVVIPLDLGTDNLILTSGFFYQRTFFVRVLLPLSHWLPTRANLLLEAKFSLHLLFGQGCPWGWVLSPFEGLKVSPGKR